jgi:serine/threonine protein kinase
VGFGPYVLLQTLGEGEFGKVKLGVHTQYGVEVAIKLIRRGSLDDEIRASKVEREIECLKVGWVWTVLIPDSQTPQYCTHV